MSQVLKKYFGPKLPEDLVPKLEELKKVFSISTEELYINWESFVTTKNSNDDAFNLANFHKLQQYIQDKLDKRSSSRTPSSIKVRKIRTTPSSIGSSPSSNYESDLATPASKRIKIESPILHRSSPLKQEIKTPLKPSSVSLNSPSAQPLKPAGTVIESLNGSLNVVPDHIEHVKLSVNFEKSKYNFRSMRSSLLEAADVLDDQIDTLSELCSAEYKILLSNAAIQSQDEIYTVGRIVSDNPAVLEGLNKDSFCLELSRLQGLGKRIPLDFSKMTKYELFPGQIVCLKGKNTTGNSFQVLEILNPPTPGATIVDVDELVHEHDTEILIFKGPYTQNSELNFDVFTKATEEIMNQSNAIILLGPFMDVNHKAIVNGDFGDEYKPCKNLDEIYQKVIIGALKKINSSVEIIVIPDPKDAITKSPAYPQPAYPNLKNFKNLKNFSNPSIFQINEISIGVSNMDVFKECKDVTTAASNTNRYERVVNHIIQQRRFFPPFPSTEPLNVPYLGLAELQSIPDILILPSVLGPCAKIIQNVLVINPGSFIRPNGGTYAKLQIQRANADNTELVDDGVMNKIWERAKVEIIKS